MSGIDMRTAKLIDLDDLKRAARGVSMGPQALDPYRSPEPVKSGAYLEIAGYPTGLQPKAQDVVDECPTCKAGRLENGVATLPNECCAIYFFGERSSAHDMWKMTEGAKRRVYDVRAARMSGGAEAAPEEDEAALRKRLTGLGRDALVEEIVRLRAEARDRRWDRDPKR